MTTTYHFSFPSGVTRYTEMDELESHYGLEFETVLPEFDVKISGHAYHDEEGVVSFSVTTHGPKGATIYNGYREDGGLQVNITGGGFRGQVFFGSGTFDLTTLDLAALERDDFDDVNDGDELWLLDPVRLDYYRAKVRKRGDKEALTVGLDIEGEVHELTFDAAGEAVEGARGEVKWSAVSEDQAHAHIASLRAAASRV